ncbi:MAG: thioredoxin domain-containing protein [Bifidobacteriaceae bacterium]|jgi:protein-disulfide isomerase|nr:thioredoxin domain-containing protein [Bifidobacteriaceae bacterium]
MSDKRPTGSSGRSTNPGQKGLSIEEAVRERARRSRQRAIIIGGALLVVVVVVVAVALILSRPSPTPPGPTGAATGSTGATTGSTGATGKATEGGAESVQPPGAQGTGGILVGQDLVPGGPAPAADEAVTVEIISDFVCPWCGLLEQAHGQALAAKAQAGEIRLVIHPVNNSLLTDLNDNYSWRSMLAVDTVAALEPDKFWAFHEVLWENQPEESQDGDELTDQQIADLAKEVGVSQATIDQLSDSPAAEWARWSSDQGLAGAGGTPTVLMYFAGSEPEVWNAWLLQGTNEAGEQAYVPGDLDAAIANVRAGNKPDAAE